MKNFITITAVAVFAFLTSCQKSEELPNVNKELTNIEQNVGQDYLIGDKSRWLNNFKYALTRQGGGWEGNYGSTCYFSRSGGYNAYPHPRSKRSWGWAYSLPTNRSGSWSARIENIRHGDGENGGYHNNAVVLYIRGIKHEVRSFNNSRIVLHRRTWGNNLRSLTLNK